MQESKHKLPNHFSFVGGSTPLAERQHGGHVGSPEQGSCDVHLGGPRAGARAQLGCFKEGEAKSPSVGLVGPGQ